jgi:arylamine N-acetyltransferase
VQGYLCTRATDDGRVTLAGNRLIETARNGERKETQVSDADLLQVLLLCPLANDADGCSAHGGGAAMR